MKVIIFITDMENIIDLFSVLIPLIALIVSICEFKRTLKETRRANAIDLLNERWEVYSYFSNLSRKDRIKARNEKDNFIKSKKLDILFSKDFVKRFEDYFRQPNFSIVSKEYKALVEEMKNEIINSIK